MKKFLLFCVASALTMSASAQKEFAVRNAIQKETPTVKVKNATEVLESKQVAKDMSLQVCVDENGKQFKRLIGNRVKAATAKAPTRAEGGTLAETFEGFTEAGWLPEGWTTVSKAEENPNPWAVVKPFSFFGDPQNEGVYSCEVAQSTEYCDEWLITPSFSVQQDDQLVFLGLIDLFFMLDMNYLDLETGEYSEKVPSAALKIWATEDGGENWTLVKDYFEQAASMTYDELMDDYFVNGGVYTTKYVGLNAFAGKNIQIGFQYVGTDGNPCGIDDVRVAKPQIECSYEFPLWAPFYGITRQLMGMSISVPVLPVYRPISWVGEYDKSIEGAFPYWIYYNAESEMDFELGDELTVTYVTDYSEEFTVRNNLFYPPTFCVSADGWTDGEFQKYTYFQSGGRADWDNKGEILTLGLSAYDPAAEGHTNATGPSGEAIFGTGEGVDEFWTRQLNAEGYLSAVSNICYTPEYPIAFREIYTQAKASGINPDATYTLDIRPVNDKGGILPPIASATIKGSDAFVGLELKTAVYYTFNFDFGETIVLDKETIGENRYMIVWSGLHNSAEELAPMQSYWESQKGINHGFIWLETADGENGAIVPISQFTNTNQGFGIMIDGWYPWLEAETTTAVVEAGNTVNIALDSYYPAEELKLNVPAGVEATVAANDAAVVGAEHLPTLIIENKGLTEEGEIVITAPGVSLAITVYGSGEVGIQLNETTNAAPAAIYNLQGVKTGADASGIYVVKMNDGTIKKVVK